MSRNEPRYTNHQRVKLANIIDPNSLKYSTKLKNILCQATKLISYVITFTTNVNLVY